jgi:hypothetical protein
MQPTCALWYFIKQASCTFNVFSVHLITSTKHSYTSHAMLMLHTHHDAHCDSSMTGL